MSEKKFNSRDGFAKDELKVFGSFKKPHDIQLFLNEIKYNPEYVTRSPKMVLKHKVANCFEGALFAAAALRMLGYKPMIVDMMAKNDDDHVIAIFKKNDLFGAVAKSNTTVLRFREPVYRTVRELVMSYFDFYFNTIGEKSLISYSSPVDLSKYDKVNWMTTENDLEFIGDHLFEIYHHEIFPKTSRPLNYADKELVDLCFSGSVTEGLFVPKKK
ncbi:MAG: hypothetical protein HYZ10_00760 [Ignavibacteriales bacterium]|nr:hypothetical protein [Ignavibacteriales bacterium]